MGPRIPPSEKLKAHNLALWQAAADKCYDKGSVCVTCRGPLDLPPVEEESCPLVYRKPRPTMCATCFDICEVLYRRRYWVNLESNERNHRKQMGLDEQGA